MTDYKSKNLDEWDDVDKANYLLTNITVMPWQTEIYEKALKAFIYNNTEISELKEIIRKARHALEMALIVIEDDRIIKRIDEAIRACNDVGC